MKLLFSKEKITLVIFIFAGIYLVFAALVMEDFDHKFGLCMFKNITGLDCPGCGMTRSFIFFLKGDYARSISYHKLGIPVFFIFSLYFMQTFSKLFLKTSFNFLSIFGKEKILFGMVILFSSVYISKLYSMGVVRILADLKNGYGWKIVELILG